MPIVTSFFNEFNSFQKEYHCHMVSFSHSWKLGPILRFKRLREGRGRCWPAAVNSNPIGIGPLITGHSLQLPALTERNPFRVPPAPSALEPSSLSRLLGRGQWAPAYRRFAAAATAAAALLFRRPDKSCRTGGARGCGPSACIPLSRPLSRSLSCCSYARTPQ